MGMMAEQEFRQWFIRFGRELMGTLIAKGGGDLTAFHESYDDMMAFVDEVTTQGRTADLLDELKPRKVVALSLFDAVVDVVLLDAFDDMKTLPSAVTSALQSRWVPMVAKHFGKFFTAHVKKLGECRLWVAGLPGLVSNGD